MARCDAIGLALSPIVVVTQVVCSCDGCFVFDLNGAVFVMAYVFIVFHHCKSPFLYKCISDKLFIGCFPVKSYNTRRILFSCGPLPLEALFGCWRIHLNSHVLE